MRIKAWQTDALEIVEGIVSSVVTRHGIAQFQVLDRWFSVKTSRKTPSINTGDSVRVLVRDRPNHSYVDVLVLERVGADRIEYTGPGIPIVLALLQAAILFVALDDDVEWLLLPALMLGVLQIGLFLHHFRLVRRFKAMRAAAPPDLKPLASPARPQIPISVPGHTAERIPSAAIPAEILEFTHDAIIIWELEGAGIVYWNRAAELLYGFSREEAAGQVTHQLLQTRTAGTIGGLETTVMRYGVWVGELRHRRRDGRFVDVESRMSLMSQGSRPTLVLEVNRDVTDRKRAEAARDEMAEQLEWARRRVSSAGAARDLECRDEEHE